MPILDWLRGGTVAALQESEPASDTGVLLEQIGVMQANLDLLQESATEQLEQDNDGWLRLDEVRYAQDFTAQGRVHVAARAQLAFHVSPLIRRAVRVRTHYTWGQGVSIAAADPAVNDVLQAFLDDPVNGQVLLDHDARAERDKDLQLDGNLALALPTNPLTGQVQVRVVPWQELADPICDPEDSESRWFYLRSWTVDAMDPRSGRMITRTMRAAYPDVSYHPGPDGRISTVQAHGGTYPVRWDSPILHVRTSSMGRSAWGVSEVFSSLGWARLHKGFLEDWASLAKALSRFAWKGKTTSKKVGGMRSALEQAAAAQDNPLPRRGSAGVGEAFVGDGASDLTPISKAGATLDSDSARPLAMMISAGMDIPYTILMGDADVGNLATAKTLDRPTELAMQGRRESWASAYRTILDHVIDSAVRAPRGRLRGTVVRDPFTGREQVDLAGEQSRDVMIDWPSLLEHDVAQLVTAIVEADSTQHLPPQIVARLLLQVLNVDDVDAVLDDMTGPDGEWIDPGARAATSAGREAVEAFRRGEDPAGLLR